MKEVSAVSKKRKEVFQDLGFGTKPFRDSDRFLNKDGSFNVRKSGRGFFPVYDTYHALIMMPWWSFGLLVLAGYLLANLVFAAIYMLLGINGLEGIYGNSWEEQYIDAFFFSAQTLTTVGYGHMSPTGVGMSLVAALEAMLGLLGFALITGLLYGRFSRPQARILFSQKAIISPYKDINAFEFRIANKRSNQLIEVEVQVVFTYFHSEHKKRKYHLLSLERNQVNFFPLSWTIVHPIEENSPILGMRKDEFFDTKGEFIILIKAFDDTFSQTVYARSSYKTSEILWGARFKGMFEEGSDGRVHLDLRQIDDYEVASLN